MTGNGIDADKRLAELLRDDLLPERDPLFRIDVLERLERRRFRRQLALALTFGALSGLRGLMPPFVGRMTHALSRAFVG
jgi:hypothetical protein